MTKREVGGRSLYSLEKLTLGGDDQWISLRTTDAANPVLLFLHGGPGMAEMPLLLSFDPRLEGRFTVVALDERGAGKSFRASRDAEKMRIEQSVADIHELTAMPKRRFGQERIYLMGAFLGQPPGRPRRPPAWEVERV